MYTYIYVYLCIYINIYVPIIIFTSKHTSYFRLKFITFLRLFIIYTFLYTYTIYIYNIINTYVISFRKYITGFS